MEAAWAICSAPIPEDGGKQEAQLSKRQAE